MATINNEKTFDAHNLEHLNKILTYNSKSVRIIGTNEDPWFCGKDVCDILEYSDYKQAINIHIDTENKSNLKILGGYSIPTLK
jgi:prophage antirepressor-like protein